MSVFDDLYAQKSKKVSDFIFDEKVAAVFADMIERSAPGYRALIKLLTVIAQQYYQPGTVCYDLGCSLGEVGISIASTLSNSEKFKIVEVDNSAAMIDQCRMHWNLADLPTNVEFICDDILQISIENASLVILNYTLQFVDIQHRDSLVRKIYDGLEPGGVLVLSEKVIDENQSTNNTLIDLHHAFKKSNGYSELEISQKRTALEKVLLPESISTHQSRLHNAGFKTVSVWFQCFNFISLLAIK